MYSLPVKALNSPPIASTSAAMSRRRRPPLGALEEHVLGEVRDAAVVGALVARAGGEHEEARHRLHVGMSARQDPEAVRQRLALEDRHRGHGIEAPVAGETDARGGRGAAGVPRRRCRPSGRCRTGRVVYTGCGTSFHAAQTGGRGGAGARGRAGRRPTRTCSSASATRGRRTDASRRRRRSPGRTVAGDRRRGPARSRSATRSSSRRPSRRGELVPHARATRARSRRSRRCAARTSSGSPTRSRSALRRRAAAVSEHGASSSPAPGATGRPRRRRC